MPFKKYILAIVTLTAILPVLAFAFDAETPPPPVKIGDVWWVYERKGEFWEPREATPAEAVALNPARPVPPALIPPPPQPFVPPARPTPLLPPPESPRFRTPDPTDAAAVAARAKALEDLKRIGPGLLRVNGIPPTPLIVIRHTHPADPIRIGLFGRDMTPIPVRPVAPRPGVWNDLNGLLNSESPFLTQPPPPSSGPSAGNLGGPGTGGSSDPSSFANWQNWFGSLGSATFQFNQTVATSGIWPILNMQMVNPSLYGFSLNFNAPPPANITYDVWMQRHGRVRLGIPGADLFIQYSDSNGDGAVDTYKFYKINPDGTLGEEMSPQAFFDYGINMGYWEINPITGKPVTNPNQEAPIAITRCEEKTRNGKKYYACYDSKGNLVVEAESPRAVGVVTANPNGPFMFYPGALPGFGIVPMPALPPPQVRP